MAATSLVRRRSWAINRTQVLAAVLVVELFAFGGVLPGFLDVDNLLDGTRSFSEAGIIALGMALVIVSGGIDLSVGSLLALVSVVIGFSAKAGVPLLLSIGLGLLTGICGGALNGALIVGLSLHPLVVTLGTYALFRGIAYAVTNAEAYSSFPDWFGLFGQYYIGDRLPLQFVNFIVLAIAVGILLSCTRFGRAVYSIGQNESVSLFSGIATGRVKIAVYMLTGFLVSIAALIQTSRIATARGNAGIGMEITAIAMVVLGGVRITGGSGTIAGVVLGVLVLSYLQIGLSFAGVRDDWALMFAGAFLLVSVFVNEFTRKDAV